MPVLPIPHFEWQVLRTVRRSKMPPAGRDLRIIPTRRTRDGTFLTALVQRGLLAYAAGSAAKPFDATYALTPLGEHAAEYGECVMDATLLVVAKPPNTKPKAKSKSRPAR